VKHSAPVLLVISLLLIAACGPGSQASAPSTEAAPSAAATSNPPTEALLPTPTPTRAAQPPVAPTPTRPL